MAAPKKPDTTKNDTEPKNEVPAEKTPAQMREELYGHLEPKKEELPVREQFKTYFGKYCRENSNVSRKLEQPVWLHLVAIKHDKPELFEKGLKNFGF